MALRRSASALLAALLACLAPGPALPAATPGLPEDLARREFEELCRRFTEGENIFFGRALADDLEARLASVHNDPLTEGLLRGRLAHELVRLGRHSEAIGHLEKLLAMLQRGEIQDEGSLRWQAHSILAIAHLQLAEDENCVARHTAASCILPFAPEAVHVEPRHSRAAATHLAAALELRPDDVRARWLLNLALLVAGDALEDVPERWRLPAGAFVSDEPFPRWRDVAREAGVLTFDLSGGAVMDDFDGDGRLDLVSSSWDPCEPLKAFRNRGDGTFENVTQPWGLASQLGGLNLVQGDYDGDGRLDLLVLRGAWLGEAGQIRNSLLRNDLDGESGRFLDVTATAGLAYPSYPTQTAAWGDYDGDGDLDLYVGNEAPSSSTNPRALVGSRGNDAYPSQLFRNDGAGRFADVARAAGVGNLRFAKGVAWGDYDDDGDLDLYVSNLGPNRLYRNAGDGTFEDVAPALGVTRPDRESFATWWFDADNDGDLDLFVAGYDATVADVVASYFAGDVGPGQPVLYRNRGDGTFEDVSAEVGLTRPLLVMGANQGDLDNDGFPDLYLGTGVPAYDALMPNVMYHNDAGRRFRDVTFAGGFGNLQKGHGVAFGDVDNDGRQELFQQLGGAFPYDAYGNVLLDGPANEARWIVLRLSGKGGNRFAVGARVVVTVRTAGKTRTVHSLVGPGSSFGGSSLQQEIGLGDAVTIDQVVIHWPAGRTEEYPGVPLDGYYRAVEGADSLEPVAVDSFDLGTTLASPESTAAPASPSPSHDHKNPLEDPSP